MINKEEKKEGESGRKGLFINGSVTETGFLDAANGLGGRGCCWGGRVH
jgi:hypothetical protein